LVTDKEIQRSGSGNELIANTKKIVTFLLFLITKILNSISV
jgi:hypothetical protein